MALALALAFIDITMTGWSGVTESEPRDCDGVISSLFYITNLESEAYQVGTCTCTCAVL